MSPVHKSERSRLNGVGDEKFGEPSPSEDRVVYWWTQDDPGCRSRFTPQGPQVEGESAARYSVSRIQYLGLRDYIRFTGVDGSAGVLPGPIRPWGTATVGQEPCTRSVKGDVSLYLSKSAPTEVKVGLLDNTWFSSSKTSTLTLGPSSAIVCD